eukprot:c8458_g1_i1.p1 GENE.c8458_g1_i1~~c8458_g1_i1.p1  ORF type:complete len:364 (-),score=89.33 c8458_g1_i1:115-1206(-)
MKIPTLSKNIFWELPLDDILVHEKQGDRSVVSMSTPTHTLERLSTGDQENILFADDENKNSANSNFESSLPSQQLFGESQENERPMIVLDPYETAVQAQEITATGAEVLSDENLDLPGKSIDGYEFTTVAEPMLLELESAVGLLEAAAPKHTTKHLKPHHAVGKQHHSRVLEQVSKRAESKLKHEKQSQPSKIEGIQSTTSSKTESSSGNGELMSDVTSSPGVSIQPCMQDATHPCVVSMDSGHSLISGPPELVRKLKAYTMPSGGCTEEETRNLPDVSFVLGGKLFTLTPMDYLIELEGQCTPAFRERPYRNGHDWVLGEHFMRTFYSVFNYDDMRVGLSRMSNIRQNLETILKPVQQPNKK